MKSFPLTVIFPLKKVLGPFLFRIFLGFPVGCDVMAALDASGEISVLATPAVAADKRPPNVLLSTTSLLSLPEMILERDSSCRQRSLQ